MTTLALDNPNPPLKADERVASVEFSEDTLSVALMDSRTITVPLYWYPRLQDADDAQRQNWQINGGGYGLHWPDIDEDLSTAGLLRGASAPAGSGKDKMRRGMNYGSKGEIMVLLPEYASDEDILNAIRDWVEMLAADNFETAYTLLRHYPDEPWTPGFLRTWISNYGWHDPMKDGRVFQVTSWKTAKVTAQGPKNHYQKVSRYDSPAADHSFGDVHFDLPLNGEWSDLTAIFSLFNHEGSLALQLDDVHVL